MKWTKVRIETIGYALAPVVVTTRELEERLLPVYERLRIQPGQLEVMTGIRERRFWEPNFPVSEGATKAVMHALSRCSVPASQIRTLIYAGVCREHFEPATAYHVAAAMKKLGQPLDPRTELFDVSNACLGVLNGVCELARRIESGEIRAGIVVSCESAREINDVMIERMLQQCDMELFKTSLATLTGGSGAVAIVLSDGSFDSSSQSHQLVGGTVRTLPEHHLLCRWGIEDQFTNCSPKSELRREFMSTDSVAILEHGVALGKQTWKDFLEELAWSAESVERVISHQVGVAHRDKILQELEISAEKDFVAYEALGNTGTVALPLAASIAEQRGFLNPGQRVALLGIGSGLSCMMLGVQW